MGKEGRSQEAKIPQIQEGCKLSNGAEQLVRKAIELGIDPEHQVAQALTEVSVNGKRTITRKRLRGLIGEIDRKMHVTFFNKNQA